MTNKIYNIIHLPDGYMYAIDKENKPIGDELSEEDLDLMSKLL